MEEDLFDGPDNGHSMNRALKQEFDALRKRLETEPARMDEGFKKSVVIASNDEVAAMGFPVKFIDIDRNDVWRWIEDLGHPDFLEPGFVPKKAYDLYIADVLLKDRANIGTLVDVGGQGSFLLNTLSRKRIVNRKVLVDVHVVEDAGVEAISASGGNVPLTDGSCDVVTCIHSIEHFQNGEDIRFMSEAGRLLTPGGKAFVFPLFLTDVDVFAFNIKSFYDASNHVNKQYDPYGGFPGWGYGEGYSRTYSTATFKKHCSDNLSGNCSIHITLVTFDGEIAPLDSELYIGNKFEYPYRALTITKKP